MAMATAVYSTQTIGRQRREIKSASYKSLTDISFSAAGLCSAPILMIVCQTWLISSEPLFNVQSQSVNGVIYHSS